MNLNEPIETCPSIFGPQDQCPLVGATEADDLVMEGELRAHLACTYCGTMLTFLDGERVEPNDDGGV